MSDLYQVEPAMLRGGTKEEADAFNGCLRVWQDRLGRNDKKLKYYCQKNLIKDLGISIPPQLRTVDAVVGWPAKAVDMLAVRSVFDGFTFADPEGGEELASVMEANDFKLTYSQAVTSELVNSCSFLTVSMGAEGEPDVLVNAYDALGAAAVWDMRKKRIKHGFTVVDIADNGAGTMVPVWVNLYTSDAVVSMRRSPSDNTWYCERMEHSQGRPLIEALRYRPSITRPFGKSRISRAVMSITDSAVRTALRTEVSSEFFTAPQRYLMGADEDTFGDGDELAKRAKKIESYLGNIFAVTANENGDIPQYGQLAQASMQPHIDYMRQLAAQFAGETGVPVSSLGVIHDNPASAEAIYAAKEDLIIEAEALNECNGTALRNVAMLVMAIQQGKTLMDLTADERTVKARFRNPMRPSVASTADAMLKQASVLPWLSDTTVMLEELGYNEEQIVRLQSEKVRAQAQQIRSQARANAMSEAMRAAQATEAPDAEANPA